jgi:hypothetical protein
MNNTKFTVLKEEQIGDVKLFLEKVTITNFEGKVGIGTRIVKKNKMGQITVLQKDNITNWDEKDNTPRAVKRYARANKDFDMFVNNSKSA